MNNINIWPCAMATIRFELDFHMLHTMDRRHRLDVAIAYKMSFHANEKIGNTQKSLQIWLIY